MYLIFALTFFKHSFANVYYVDAKGSDIVGDGSVDRPWKTLKYAMANVMANQGHMVKVSEGIFIETGLVEVPLGVSIEGSGMDATIFKASSSFYYHPSSDPGYSTDKFLISLNEFNPRDGNQSLRNFSIDGDSKKLHGGIYVRYRNGVVIDGVKVQNTNYCGIWLWDVNDSQVTNTQLINCAWGNTGYSSGALNLGNVERVEISQLNVDENTGYGIKALGPDGYNDIFNLSIHDCKISVAPYGLWNNGTSPNLAIELWQSTLVGCEIYNCYVDNTISLVNSALPPTGIQTIRVHDNFLDIDTRAHGAGYGIELSVHDAEIDHNYFFKGSYGIANWDNPMMNWDIHHNVFYALNEPTVGEVVRSQWSGLHNLKFYNNTIEFTGSQTMNVIGIYGNTSENIDIKNNLVINSNTSYSSYPNQLIHTQNGATINTNGFQVLNNSTTNLDPGELLNLIIILPIPNPLINLFNLANPSVLRSGNRPTPYYKPAPGSSLINAGLNVGQPYAGSAPDIGAYESDAFLMPNRLPLVSILNPAVNANYPTDIPITIAANASDPDGSITKVEFFNGVGKLGEVTTAPYQFVWANPSAGKVFITARATDDRNAVTTSTVCPITITSGSIIESDGGGIKFGLYAPDAILTGGMRLIEDITATKGAYFEMPEENGKNESLPPSSVATFNFQLPVTSNFEIWVRVRSPSVDNEQYFIKLNEGDWTTWNAGVHGEWTWVKISDPMNGESLQYSLTADFNIFAMGWHDAKVQIDRIIITNDFTFDPSGLRNQENGTFTVYPNPALDEVIVNYFSDVQQRVEIFIHNIQSKMIMRAVVEVSIGVNKIPVDIRDLGNNLYFVSIRSSKGQRRSTKLIVFH